MKKLVLTIIAVAAAMIAANAQTVETVQEYTQFSTIDASKYFEVKLCYGPTYSATITADQLIAENVQSYVKGNTLFLTIDEKHYAPEVKKALKGKNAIVPILRAVVTVPTISSIKLSDNVMLYSEDNIKADVLKIDASNTSTVKNLILDAQDVALKVSNKAQARLDVYCNSISLDASNNAAANVTVNCSSAALGTAGSANVTANLAAKTVSVKTQGSSNLTLTGSADKIIVDGSNSSNLYADGTVVTDADVTLSNSSLCEINAKEHLKVDLTGSSHLIFNGDPKVNVNRIVSSSMTRSSDTKSKKK